MHMRTPGAGRDTRSLAEMAPKVRKDVRRENVAGDHIDRHAGRERVERSRAGDREVAKTRRQADAKKAEEERPRAQHLQWLDERRYHRLLVVSVWQAAREHADEQRRDQEAHHEFVESAPDLADAG